MIRVGTAGWSYADWEGLVYGKGVSTSREALPTLARLFDVLEVNVSFYRPPTPAMTARWVERVADRPAFRFTAKLWQGFTHQRDQPFPEEERAFKEGIAPLRDSGRLLAVLAQFPHSYHYSPGNLQHLRGLLERFAGLRLVIEVRHASWMAEPAREPFIRVLADHGAGFCCVDQPSFRTTLQPHEIVVGGVGYIRLHGRNRSSWFRQGPGATERYDYLYGPGEMTEWAERAVRMRELGPSGADLVVIANNHYRGKAVANALELQDLLTGRKREVLPELIAAYPELEKHAVAAPARRGTQRVLPL